ncbi:MAG TPA: hypothetical protein PLJ47_07870 [Candidatus Hydrogenedentes bacterium]|nr:hypothetical protein [Candidatus Hydrogenedentota bacterium]
METKPTRINLIDNLAKVANGSCVHAINQTFRRMEIAEKEIARAQRKHPKHKDRVFQVFRQLCPTPPLARVLDDVYRMHCRELIDRSIQCEDTKPATEAEVLGFLSQASLEAPLDRIPSLLYQQLFADILPVQARALPSLGRIDSLDSYEQNAVAELLHTLRRKLAIKRG